MSAGVLLIDYDRDGWLDIYFTNSPTVDMAIKGEKARGALFHNNHDGTFTDVTDKAVIATPGFSFGGAVGDYNNDGWPDLYISCLGGNVLYRHNGDGTFTDVTKQVGVADGGQRRGDHWGPELQGRRLKGKSRGSIERERLSAVSTDRHQ